MKKITLILLLIMSLSAFSQQEDPSINKFVFESMTYKTLDFKTNEWTKWAEWSEFRSLLVVNHSEYKLELYANKHMTYDIIDILPIYETDKGNSVYTWECIDNMDEEIIFRLIETDFKRNIYQLFIVEDNIQIFYNSK